MSAFSYICSYFVRYWRCAVTLSYSSSSSFSTGLFVRSGFVEPLELIVTEGKNRVLIVQVFLKPSKVLVLRHNV